MALTITPAVSGLTLNNSSSPINPDNVTQNQLGYNTNVSLFGQTDGGLYSSAFSPSWVHQIYGDFRTGQIATRGKNNGTWQSWRILLDSSNYTSYSPSLTGTGASGSWGISVTGNAANVTGTVAIANGGTGATTAAAARTNLGATTLGGNLFTLTNVAAISFPRINADNTVSALDAATFRTAIGAGTSSTTGTVTSVGGTGTVSGLTLTGAVTGSGNLTLGGAITGFLPTSGGTLTGNLLFGNATSPNTHFIQFGDNSGWTLRMMTSVSGTPTERFRFVDTGGFNAVGAITQNGNQVLHAGNFNSYAPTLTGTGASGTWGISVTGNAATATNCNSANAKWVSAAIAGSQGSNVSAVEVRNAGGTGDSNLANITFHCTGAYGTSLHLRPDGFFGVGGWSASSWRWYVNLNGGDMVAAGNVTAYSDERLKKDWAPISGSFVEELAKVKSGTYTRIDTNERQAGASAQDWQKLLPEVVVAGADDDKTLTLAYGNAALVSAVELAKRVVEQNARIERLEALINTLLNKE
jgi:hypothetical protein